MALVDGKFVLPNGLPALGEQPMQSADIGPADLWDIGWFDYNDNATGTTPINLPATNAWVALTNDEAGAFTQKGFAPSGVTDVWDSTTGKFDFSELQNGDMVDIRLDVEVTTSTNNQEFDIALNLAQAPGAPYDLFFASNVLVKTSGTTAKIFRWIGVYIGDDNTRLNPAQFRARSASAATVRVNGWYCKVTKKGFV